MKLGLGLGLQKSSGLQPSWAVSSPVTDTTYAPSSIPEFQDSPVQGTFVVHFNDPDPSASSDMGVFWVGQSSGTNNGIYLQKRSTGGAPWRFACLSGGVTQFFYDYGNANFHAGEHKCVVKYEANNIAFFMNGCKIVWQATSVTMPVDVSDGITVGNMGSGGSDLYDGSFSYAAYYPDVLTDNQCIALSRNNNILSSVTNDPDLDAIAFLGQSNASGRASGAPSYTNTSLMNLIANNGTKGSYSDPYDSTTSAVFTNLSDTSPNIGYAGYTIDDLSGLTSRETAALPANMQTTEIGSDWSPDNTSGNVHFMGGVLYSAIQQIKFGIQHGNLKSVVWHQGETDAINGISEAAYEAALSSTLLTIRSALGLDLYFAIMSLHAWHTDTTATQSNWNAIDDALENAAVSIPNAGFVDISDLDGISGNRVHLSLTSNETAGNRLATHLNTNVY